MLLQNVVKPGPEDIDDPILCVGLLLFAVSTQDCGQSRRSSVRTGTEGMITLLPIHILSDI